MLPLPDPIDVHCADQECMFVQAVLPNGLQMLTGDAAGCLHLWELPQSALEHGDLPQCQVPSEAVSARMMHFPVKPGQ